MNRHDPLTPEERELARLLGRSGGSMPPPALDARILAAARAAARSASPPAALPPVPGAGEQPPHRHGDTDTPRRQHRRTRWPMFSGLAASLLLACGLAWQLRPEPPPIPSPATYGRVGDATTAAAEVSTPTVATTPAAQPVAAPAPRAPAVERAEAMPIAAPATAMKRATAPASASAAATTPVASAPPAPATTALPARSLARAAPGQTVQRMASEQTRGQPTAPMAFAPLPAPAVAVAEPFAAQLAEDEQLPPRQWLKRIGEHRDRGERALAAASLQRFQLRHPDRRIPRGLRPLLEQQ